LLQSHGKPVILQNENNIYCLVIDSMLTKKLGYISILLVKFTQQHNVCSLAHSTSVI